MVGTNLEAKIKERAYQLWEGEGRPHGKHLEHWRRAEQEVKSQAGQSILQRPVEQANPAPRMSPTSPAEAAAAAGESKRARTKATAKTKTKAEPKGKTAARKPRSGTTKPTV